jgi:DNA-binding response OmpR family regulator
MEITERSSKYKKINVLIVEDNVDVQKLITLHLKYFGCNVFLQKFSENFSLEELQIYQMILISVLPDKSGIKLLMHIHREINDCNFFVKAKFFAYTACGKEMAETCRDCGFDDVLEAPASLKYYQMLLEKFYPKS